MTESALFAALLTVPVWRSWSSLGWRRFPILLSLAIAAALQLLAVHNRNTADWSKEVDLTLENREPLWHWRGGLLASHFDFQNFVAEGRGPESLARITVGAVAGFATDGKAAPRLAITGRPRPGNTLRLVIKDGPPERTGLLVVAMAFPHGHPRAGERTQFTAAHRLSEEGSYEQAFTIPPGDRFEGCTLEIAAVYADAAALSQLELTNSVRVRIGR